MSNPYEQCARCGSLMVDRAAHLSWHIEQDRRHSDLVDACASIVDALVSVGRVQDLTAQIEDL